MRTIMKLALAGTASLAVAAPANAAVLLFNGLTTNGAAFTTLNEAGFTISTLLGSVTQNLTGGNAAPSLQFSNFGGTIEITLTGGGTFSASSVDLLGGSFITQAYLGGNAIGGNGAGFTFGDSTGTFASYALPTVVMDRLTINLNQGGNTNFAGGLDNLTLTPTVTVPSVPEPAAWALMLAGFGAIGVSMRQGKRPVTRIKYT
jgi:hypothetical protein